MASRTEKRKLIRIAATLKPVVIVGARGPSDSVLTEIERALTDHELIKIRLGEDDRDARRDTAARLAEALSAQLIQQVGKTIVLYRANPNADRKLSNVARATPQ